MLFKDKVVIVTGAASGIGKATAQAFAAEGAKLVLGDVVGDKLTATVEELKAGGAEVVGLVGNIADVNDANALVDLAKSRFGRLDILVNNAGLNILERRWSDLTPPNADHIIAGNLNAAYYNVIACLPIMRWRIRRRSLSFIKPPSITHEKMTC